MTDLQVSYRPLAALIPYATNARTHSEAQVAQIAASIVEFGWTNPVLVDGANGVIAGHGRLLAARQLGLHKVPVIELGHLSPVQKRAYVLADNRLAENAGWDDALLRLELEALQLADFDLGLTGFDEATVCSLLANPTGTPGRTDEDAVPAPLAAAVTRPGDLWVLGEHRLLCGNSADATDVDRLLGGDGGVDLVNTDPPYNVRVEPRSNNAIAAGLSSFTTAHHPAPAVARHPARPPPPTRQLRPKDRPLANDFVSDGDFDDLLNAWFGNLARVLRPGRSFYIWGGYANCGNYPPVLKRHDLYFAQAIIWVKQHPVLTRKDFMGNHEWCFYGWRGGAAHRYFGPANATDVWAVKKVNPQAMVHLTEKPVELARLAIEYSSAPGEVVLDLFGGSGSTLIAAERTGRHARLLELDPHYCDVILRRWQQFTGRAATRDGVTFDTVAGLAGPVTDLDKAQPSQRLGD